MPTAEKEQAVESIKGRFTSSESVILVDYRGLTVKEMQELRAKVRASGADITVFKNRLTQIALHELAMPSLDEYLTGPTAFVFAGPDPVMPAKVLREFSKEHKSLEIKGGLMQNQVVDAVAVKVIAALPTRDELVAKLMGSLLNPIRGFMGMANAPASAFVRAVRVVAEQKAAA